MDRFRHVPQPLGMLFPYTFSFPFFRSPDNIPREFAGLDNNGQLTEDVYPLNGEYYLPLYR